MQEGLACANCMASASDTFAWHPRSPRAGLASLAFALAVARHPCSGRGIPSGLRLRAASIVGPSGLPSVAALVLTCTLARRTCLARAGSRACLLCFGPYQRLCAASVLGPSGIPSLFAGAAPAKLGAFKSKTRARCFFMIMNLSLSCG